MKQKIDVEINPKTAINGNVVILCPYHVEITPSCVVDMENGCFHCFSCGTDGFITTKDSYLYRGGFTSTFWIELRPTKPWWARWWVVISGWRWRMRRFVRSRLA